MSVCKTPPTSPVNPTEAVSPKSYNEPPREQAPNGSVRSDHTAPRPAPLPRRPAGSRRVPLRDGNGCGPASGEAGRAVTRHQNPGPPSLPRYPPPAPPPTARGDPGRPGRQRSPGDGESASGRSPGRPTRTDPTPMRFAATTRRSLRPARLRFHRGTSALRAGRRVALDAPPAPVDPANPIPLPTPAWMTPSGR